VKRASESEPLYFTIVRGVIKLETVKSTIINDHIGYIRISQFSETTAEAMEQHIDELTGKDVDSLIVDLRNNPGGLLTSVITITDMFLEKGVIVSTKGRNRAQNQTYYAQKTATIPDTPLIVMVNGGSASASEILAGAVKDNDRGTLVGETTFGKGSVQTVRELADGSGIRITTALYYSPSGESIDREGIEPHVHVEAVEISAEEADLIKEIEEQEFIEDFVKEYSSFTETEFDGFMNRLTKNGFKIRPIIVKRLIKNELEKDVIPSLVDLDYDLQLSHAVEMIQSGEI
jgi:carboxyl-terminal processing protease